MFDDDDWLGGGHQPPYIPILLFLLLTLCVSGWANCVSVSEIVSLGYVSTHCYTAKCLEPSFGYSGPLCSETNLCDCSGTITKGNYTYILSSAVTSQCNTTDICQTFNGGNKICLSTVRCDSQCEAEQKQCEDNGGTWQPSSNPNECGECKTCKNDTLWYSDSSCTGPNGAGMYVNSVVKHQIKDCEETTIEMSWQSSKCDNEKDTTYKCLGTVNGHTVMMRAPSGATFNCEADGSCQFAMNKIALGECGPSPSPNPNSSNSNNSSSSEEQSSSSSDEQSSSSEEEPNSSETEQQNSSGSVTVAELPQRLYDSLGAIDASIQWYQPLVNGIYDGVYDISGTAHDMNVNLINITESTAGINDKMGTANNYLQQIANKDFSPDIHVGSPDVNIDVSGIQSNQNQTRDSLHNTNSLLEDIKGLLGSSGSDTIHVDTSKAPASIDSALKHWGNNSNHTFGAAGLDSSGWGAAQKGMEDYSDSVTNDVGMINPFAEGNCDTTGGRKCDGQYIGGHGLDSATKRYKSAYRELGDSITNGAYGDSLRNWGSKFTSSRLSGSGSDNCPAILNRAWNVPIGNVNMTFGPIGKYICTPIFGGLNAFGLARTLLRAIVAIACMWFLFKCATGFKGSGSEDDD